MASFLAIGRPVGPECGEQVSGEGALQTVLGLGS